MPENGLWEHDRLNGGGGSKVYSKMYLGEGYEEDFEPAGNSYADQFLGGESAWEESAAYVEREREAFHEDDREEPRLQPEEKPMAPPRFERPENVLQNRIRDPEIVRKIYELRSAYSPAELPRLSSRSEKLLNANYRQLSVVESGLLSKKRAVKTVYVTSPFRGSGKTIAAVSMAYALSVYGGNDTLLVDGHFQSPQIHRLFNVRNSLGLSDALTQQATAMDVIIPTAYDHLFVVTNGNRSNVQVSYEGEMIDKVLRFYSRGFNYIIFDGAAVFASPEPAFFAPYFDGVVVTLECEKTKWEVAQMTVEKIMNAGGSVTGIILNRRKFYVPRAVYNKI